MFVYNLCVRIFHAIVSLAGIAHEKARLFTEGRKRSKALLREYASQKHEHTWWFHCASLGEFEQARPLMEYFKKNDPSIKIALSFFSPSGFEVRKNYAYAEIVFYLPADTPPNASFVLDALKPERIFFIKYEFWLNYIQQAYEKKFHIYLVSALFRPDQIFFRWYGGIFRRGLRSYKKIFVQDAGSATLAESIGVRTVISGDTRFDRVMENRSAAQRDDILEAFKDGKKLLIIGSSWPEEEKMIFSFYKPSAGYKLIIAPHDISRKIDPGDDTRWAYYTNASKVNLINIDILILDTMGKLSTAYQYADMAMVGGGFRNALHNILEPAAFGIPVIYGPQTDKHPEGRDLTEHGGGFMIAGATELEKIINRLNTDDIFRKLAGEKAFAYIKNGSGATMTIVNEMIKHD
jgi:3-deoxy-D-manno-octulosonic-acid transferase